MSIASWRRSPRRSSRSPSSTAPRSRAQSASRSTKTFCRSMPSASPAERRPPCRASSADAMAYRRRNSPRRWSRRCSTNSISRRRRTISPSASMTTSPTPASPSIPISRPKTRARCAHCSTGSARTARSGRTRTRSRSSAKGLTAGFRAISSTTSKKAGSVTVSHLRFGPNPIRSTYLISKANFVACHQFQFLNRVDMLAAAEEGATFLLNAPHGANEVWEHLPREVQDGIIHKKLKVYVIDGYAAAREAGMGSRINTIMQTCFFAISGVLPRDEAIKQIKKAIEDTYGKRGAAAVQKNFAAVDTTLARLHEVRVPDQVTSVFEMLPPVPARAPAFVRDVLGTMIAGKGDTLPVSALPIDGTFPTGTAQWEKRNIAQQIPVWDENLCIQCGKCVLVCPHSVIRAKVYNGEQLADAPPTFKSTKPRWREFESQRYTLQVSPEDCTGCRLCVEVCPAKSKSEVKHKAINMEAQAPLRESENANWDFFLKLPDADRDGLRHNLVKDVQLLEPLFEFAGACAGCGETPYIKLLTQLFGDRLMIANATGCSSIYGGNLPTTPYTSNHEGRGPTWSNSLFEDNAEFGLGMRLAVDKKTQFARELVTRVNGELGGVLIKGLLEGDQSTEKGIEEQRARVAELKQKLDHVKMYFRKSILIGLILYNDIP